MDLIANVVRHWFTAHPGNGHRPALLRGRSLTVILAFIVIVQGFVILQSGEVASRIPLLGEILSSVIVSETNVHRAGSAMPALKPNAILDAAAGAKARDMAAKSYFAHTSPEGISPWYWFQQFGYRYAYAGENLAVNFSDSKDVTDAWMNSPAHRANILSQRFTEIGIGMARGMYEGKEVVFVVQLFGKPATAPATTPKPAPVASKPVAVKPKPVAPVATTTTSTVPLPQPMFVAVAGADNEATSTAPSSTLAEAPESAIRGGAAVIAFLKSPKSTANAAAVLFVLLIGLVLLGKIWKVGIVHPRMVASALFVLAVSAGIFILNNYQFVAQAQVF